MKKGNPTKSFSPKQRLAGMYSHKNQLCDVNALKLALCLTSAWFYSLSYLYHIKHAICKL
jgi:hypothetical protein